VTANEGDGEPGPSGGARIRTYEDAEEGQQGGGDASQSKSKSHTRGYVTANEGEGEQGQSGGARIRTYEDQQGGGARSESNTNSRNRNYVAAKDGEGEGEGEQSGGGDRSQSRLRGYAGMDGIPKSKTPAKDKYMSANEGADDGENKAGGVRSQISDSCPGCEKNADRSKTNARSHDYLVWKGVADEAGVRPPNQQLHEGIESSGQDGEGGGGEHTRNKQKRSGVAGMPAWSVALVAVTVVLLLAAICMRRMHKKTMAQSNEYTPLIDQGV
jgi:hypothetical protein